LAALACVVGIIVFTVVGSQMQLANMTPEEREAYYAEQQLKIEQREQKRQRTSEQRQRNWRKIGELRKRPKDKPRGIAD
jgi:hypothetical protein